MNADILLGLIAGGGLTLLWKILDLVYEYIKMGSLIKKGGYDLGFYFGKQIKKYGLDKITDEELKAKTIKDLDAMGNEIDRGWDDGIRGIKNV